MKVGIVGMGLMGKRRKQFLDDDDALVAVHDPLVAPFGTFEECDAVIVATSTPELIRAALTIPITTKLLIEKPCATSVVELEQLRHRDVTPGYTLTSYPGIIAAKKALAEEDLGAILYARMTYGHGGGATGWRAQTGELLDQGSHLIDLAQHLFGPMAVTHARTDFAITPHAEDNVFLTCTGTDSDVIVEMHASWTLWQPTFCVEIVCANGLVRVSGLGTPTYGPHKLEVRTRRDAISETVYANAFEVAHRAEWRVFKRRWQRGPDVNDSVGYRRAMSTLRLIDTAHALASRRNGESNILVAHPTREGVEMLDRFSDERDGVARRRSA